MIIYIDSVGLSLNMYTYGWTSRLQYYALTVMQIRSYTFV